MKPILLLIDLQNDFLAAKGMEPGRGGIVERAATLLRCCRECSIPVVHVWTTVSRRHDKRMPHWKETNRWICEEGTRGHRSPDQLSPADAELIIHKTSFSGFSNALLEQELKRHGADTVIIAGVHLHACVRQTTLDAAERGFKVWIAGDAVGSDDPVHGAITRRYLESRVARVADVETLVAGLRGDIRTPRQISSVAEIVATTAQHARNAFKPWCDGSASAKRTILERLACSIEGQATELAEQMAREIGKPIVFGKTEALRSANMLRAIMGRFASLGDEGSGSGTTVRHRPHGVVALITPWNNPIYIALGKIAPALLGGNTVVWKPSPHAATLSGKLLGMLTEAGCPAGVVNLLDGDRNAAEALMSHPQIDAVSLTGSSLAGSSAQEICSRRRIPLQAELGGNNAAIVWSDADLPHAAQQVSDGAFAMAGQRCTANRRVIVHDEVYDAFVNLLSKATSNLPSGNPFQPETRLGPLVNASHGARIATLLDQCRSDKIHILVPPQNFFTAPDAKHSEAWHPPVIVQCDDPTHDIVQEETFGPVLVIQKASDWDTAIHLCNGVRQGLAAALFSTSREIQERFLNEAQAGILKINRSTADAEVDAPFGGWKASGIGPPEHGRFDLDFYTRPQTCYHDSPPSPDISPVTPS